MAISLTDNNMGFLKTHTCLGYICFVSTNLFYEWSLKVKCTEKCECKRIFKAKVFCVVVLNIISILIYS